MKKISKYIIMALLTLAATTPLVQARTLGPIVRMGDTGTDAKDYYCEESKVGEVCIATQYAADSYCKSIKSRLPTLRELALYAQTLGAKGIRETHFKNVDMSKPQVQAEIKQMEGLKYDAIYKGFGEKIVVDFYYSHKGYLHPEGDLGRYLYFSSTIGPESSSFAFLLNGYSGDIHDEFRDDATDHKYNYHAIRCVL